MGACLLLEAPRIWPWRGATGTRPCQRDCTPPSWEWDSPPRAQL